MALVHDGQVSRMTDLPLHRPTIAVTIVVGLLCWGCTGGSPPVPAGQFAPMTEAQPATSMEATTASPSSRTGPTATPQPSSPSPQSTTGLPNATPDTGPSPAATSDADDSAEVDDDVDPTSVDPANVDRTDPEAVAEGFACGLYVSPPEQEAVATIAERLRPLATEAVLVDVQTLGFPSDAGERRDATMTGLVASGVDTYEVTCHVVFRDARSGAPSRSPETTTIRVHLARAPGDTWEVDAMDLVV